MIVYFSGTGNSRHVALRLAELVKDGQTLDAGRCIRSDERPVLESEAPYVFVCPTYAWRIPRIFEKFLRGAEFTGNDRVYFVMTCGDGKRGVSCGGPIRSWPRRRRASWRARSCPIIPEGCRGGCFRR